MSAQVSLEFISLLSLLFIFLFLTIYHSSNLYIQTNRAKVLKEAQTISDQIASEINLALKAGSGYSRIFTIPQKISNAIDYNITVKDYLVILSWNNGFVQSTILTRNISGEILKGENLIRNLNGVVYVNQ
ncbi:MAG: hypothetical protein QXR09_01390 [Candidatus Aenigmatarchaeota archaeon]